LRIERPRRREQQMSALHAGSRVLSPESKRGPARRRNCRSSRANGFDALFARCAGVHVDFHAHRQFDNFRSLPAHSILPTSLTRIPRRGGT
jgi:hypothetical protein